MNKDMAEAMASVITHCGSASACCRALMQVRSNFLWFEGDVLVPFRPTVPFGLAFKTVLSRVDGSNGLEARYA